MKNSQLKQFQCLSYKLRPFSSCGPPRPPSDPCGCQTQLPGVGPKVAPPSVCRPPPLPPNPCCPEYHHGHNTWKKFRALFFFVSVPLIVVQTISAMGHEPPEKGECRDYEYMRIRTKRFPWGDGVKSLFHNDHTNHLPGECVAAEEECD